MNEQAQRIAIAAFCGWTQIEDRSVSLMMAPGTYVYGYPPQGALIGQKKELPDYLRDLNAIHEAEIVCIFTKGKGMVYGRELHVACNNEPSVEVNGVAFNRWSFSATAKQRSVALLKTIHEWRD